MIVGKLTVLLGLDRTGFTTGINTATGQITLFQKATDKTFRMIGTAMKLGLLAISAAMIKAVVDAGKFEKALANVSTMLDKKTMPMMKGFQKGLLSMSQEFGESTDTLAKGLYDILSASIPAAEALDVLEVSAIAAKAGLTDTGTAADALTTLMNSFADASKDAEYYSDLMFATVLHGKTTFAELAPAIGNVATLMATVGGTTEELSAFLSILTRNGIDTRVAVTNLKGVLTAMLKPSEDLTEALDGMTVKTDGFAAIMEHVSKLPPADLAKMFPNVRALTGVVVAAGEMSEEVEKINTLMESGSPALEAYRKQTDTMAFAWSQFKATLKATSITMGQELLPKIRELFGSLTAWLKDNTDKFANFAKNFLDAIIKIVSTLSKFKEAIVALSAGMLAMMVIQKVTTAIAAFGIAVNISMGAVGAIAAAIGLLVFAFQKIRAAVKEQRADEELLRQAREGSLTMIEDYNKALDLMSEKGESLVKSQAHQANMIKGFAADAARYGVDLKNLKTADNEAVKNSTELIRENMKAFQERTEAAIKAEGELAEAERQRFIDEQLANQKRIEDEMRLAAAERARLDEIDTIKNAIINLMMTDAERFEAERIHMEELGFSHEDTLLYLNEKYPEALEEKMEFDETEYENYTDILGRKRMSIEELAQFEIDMIVETEAREKKKWDDLKGKITDVINVAKTLVSSLGGVFDQFFENRLVKLNNWHQAWENIANEEYTTELARINDLELSEEEKAELIQALDEETATAADAHNKELREKEAEYALKQFKFDKAMAIVNTVINTIAAVAQALPNIPLSVIVGILGAIQVGLIAAKQPPETPNFIRGGLNKMIDGGAFRGDPGIDTNTIAVTSGEYIMPPQQTADNMEELEAMRAGEERPPIIIEPMPLIVQYDGNTLFDLMIGFMTEESDQGSFRLNPQILGDPS